MGGKSRWVTRKIECPDGKGASSLLLEWQIEKGRKAIRSISCDNPKLMDYSGEDCHWHCLEKISRSAI